MSGKPQGDLRSRKRPPKVNGDKPTNSPARSGTGSNTLLLGCLALVITVSVALIASYMPSSMGTVDRVQTPFDAPKIMGNGSSFSPELTASRLWGSYRPQVYFGLRPRLPQSIIAGMMWQPFFHGAPSVRGLRHICRQEDNLLRYGWLKHDGQTFGSQEILEEDFVLMTEFVKRPHGRHGGDWSVRISGKPRQSSARTSSKYKHQIALFFYLYNEGEGSLLPVIEPPRTKRAHPRLSKVSGETPELGTFVVNLPAKGALGHDFLVSHTNEVAFLHDFVQEKLIFGGKRLDEVSLGDCLAALFATTGMGFFTCLQKLFPPKPNIVVQQALFDLPFQMDVTFNSLTGDGQSEPLAGAALTAALKEHHAKFDERFEATFQLKKKKFSSDLVKFAQAALSNMLGGMGYFYGSSLITSSFLNRPVKYWDAALFTAVPSRSFFPRGFLWDEGFHQLLISRWDSTIAKESLGHWFDLINADGWIPREQILGPEALSRVPAEFVVQHNENANPPTFFLTIQSMLRHEQMDIAFLRHLFPRLRVWFEWFNVTQAGPVPLSYRWRGRNATTNRELNPKTLTSGLDDYPRSTHPTDTERHVDLRCWITLASGIMSKIAAGVGEPADSYSKLHKQLKDIAGLNKLHWNKKLKSFSDYGKHADKVRLVRVTELAPKQPGVRAQKTISKKLRKVTGSPSEKLVPVFGYISLFPLLLQLLEPNSPELGHLLENLNQTKLLWTPFGLRSVAKNDLYYNADNTEHDRPYWRGPIWININYLCVRALHHYGNVDGPYKKVAKKLYKSLRKNLIDNIYRQYQWTGYIWEQYDDMTGQGKGTRPFTGWSALVVLLMGELY